MNELRAQIERAKGTAEALAKAETVEELNRHRYGGMVEAYEDVLAALDAEKVLAEIDTELFHLGGGKCILLEFGFDAPVVGDAVPVRVCIYERGKGNE